MIDKLFENYPSMPLRGSWQNQRNANGVTICKKLPSSTFTIYFKPTWKYMIICSNRITLNEELNSTVSEKIILSNSTKAQMTSASPLEPLEFNKIPYLSE
jgi:hypothetical protein